MRRLVKTTEIVRFRSVRNPFVVLNEEQPRVEKSRAQKIAFQRDQSNFPSFPAAWRSVKKPMGRFKSRLDAFYIVKGPRLPAAPLPNNLSSAQKRISALPKSNPNDLLSWHVRPRSRMKELPLQSFPNRRLVTVLSLNISVSQGWGWMSFGRGSPQNCWFCRKRLILWLN